MALCIGDALRDADGLLREIEVLDLQAPDVLTPGGELQKHSHISSMRLSKVTSYMFDWFSGFPVYNFCWRKGEYK